MSKLNFKGPFHLKELRTIAEIKNGKGIYIWGFMYQKNGETIGEAVDFSANGLPVEFDPGTMQFIPYYVGIGDRTTIFTRLLAHSKPKHGHASKYIRLSHDYMKEFFIGSPLNKKFSIYQFPIKVGNKPNNEAALKLINSSQTSKITYFNSADCLSAIYPVITLTRKTRIIHGKAYNGYPISNQSIPPSPGNPRGLLQDTLSDLVNDKNNFWFCYSLNPDDQPLTKLETYTFWTLKGLTTGQTESFENINDFSHIIKADPRLNIFKGYCSKGFPGYF